MDYIRIMFGVVMLHFHGASASVYISTTSRGYTSTETGNPFFECYRSSPYLNTAVSKGRYVYVYNDRLPPASPVNAANADPPFSEAFNAGDPPIQAFRINLETSDHSSYGAFYCAVSLDGERTVVPTLFLRSDVRFVPTNGRFSKTVNKGDVNVTVDFTEVTPSVILKDWRFNGTTDGSVTISAGKIFRELTVYTIIGEVDTSHGGVYELHLLGERGQARAGLLRLIVRACPAGHYDVSNECTQICPSCYNGGICHDQTGICICPSGFQGDGCEMACGGNRYGRNCEYRCDYEIPDDSTACSGLQVCVPDPYGCSCTPGYKGLDCTTECDQGEFGASCTETCHCVSGECDRFTGVCTGSSTECEPERTGTNCQECMIGRYGPDCEPFTVSYEKTNKGQLTSFVCLLEGGNLISTAPVVNLYSKFGSGNYTQENIIPLGKGYPPNEKFLFLVRDVKVGEFFVCSLSDVNNFFSDTMTTDGEFIAPAPTVSVEATSETVTVRWSAASPAHLNGDLQGYQLRYTRTKPEPLDPVLVNVMCNEYVITEGATKDSEFEIEVRVLNGAGYGEWSPLMTSPLPGKNGSLGDESRYSLRALLLTGLIPSIILICVICIILIVGFFRRRQPGKGESEKSTHDDSQSPETANTYQDLYERVSNDGTAYQELELKSVPQGDTDYINIEEGPRGRKNILKSIENADC